MQTVIAVFSGECDATHRAGLRAAFDELSAEGHVCFDFSAVSYADSTCIAELIRVHGLRRAGGLSVPTIVVSPSLRRLFAVLKLQAIFSLADTLDDLLPKNGERVVLRYQLAGDHSEDPPVALHSTRGVAPAPLWDGNVATPREGARLG